MDAKSHPYCCHKIIVVLSNFLNVVYNIPRTYCIRRNIEALSGHWPRSLSRPSGRSLVAIAASLQTAPGGLWSCCLDPMEWPTCSANHDVFLVAFRNPTTKNSFHLLILDVEYFDVHWFCILTVIVFSFSVSHGVCFDDLTALGVPRYPHIHLPFCRSRV